MDRFERVHRRELPAITCLTPIGQLLIAMRIAQGPTRRELAERLDTARLYSAAWLATLRDGQSNSYQTLV